MLTKGKRLVDLLQKLLRDSHIKSNVKIYSFPTIILQFSKNGLRQEIFCSESQQIACDLCHALQIMRSTG
jgi:hypothetical protein